MPNTYLSAIALSTSNNYIMNSRAHVTHTYRTYLKPRERGEFRMRIWCSNNVDSTWDDGAIARANLPGGTWRIESAYLADGGPDPDGSVVGGTEVPFTFDSARTRLVQPGETFWSDPTPRCITVPKGHYVAFSWTITTVSDGVSIPYNTESMLAFGYDAPGHAADQASSEAFKRSESCLVLPDFIGYEREVEKRIVFLGDSITQGVRTPVDAEAYWVARIAQALPASYGVWNIGSGWGRAYDASSDGAWLAKAKQADEIVIALGVNDIGTAGRSSSEVAEDLRRIVDRLKIYKPSMQVYLCTVPTFNFTGAQETAWRQVNEAIRGEGFHGVDRVFDIAAVLSQEAPNDNLMRPEYMSDSADAHPNGHAGEAIAAAFLEWYKERTA
jgi:lysophospholipase L1-like esterase